MIPYHPRKVTRPIRYCENVRSDTDSGAGVWCGRVGKYVKPQGWINGITKEEADYPVGKPRKAVEPTALGDIDS